MANFEDMARAAAAQKAGEKAANEAAENFNPDNLSPAAAAAVVFDRAEARHGEIRAELADKASKGLVNGWGIALLVLILAAIAAGALWALRTDGKIDKILSLPCLTQCEVQESEPEPEPVLVQGPSIDESRCYLADNTILRVNDPHDGFHVLGLAKTYPLRQFGQYKLYACRLADTSPSPQQPVVVAKPCEQGMVDTGRFTAEGARICERPREVDPPRPERPDRDDRRDRDRDRDEDHGGTPTDPDPTPGGNRDEGHGGTPADPDAAPAGSDADTGGRAEGNGGTSA